MAEDLRPPNAGDLTEGENGGQKSNVFVEEQYRVWDAPGAPNTDRPPLTGRTGTLRSDITRQYVSSQPNQWYLSLIRVLPFAIDDISEEFGADLYYRFLFDAIVFSSVVSFKAAVLEDGLTLRPAITDSGHDLYDRSSKLLVDAEAMLDAYPGNIDDWLWEMTDAIWRGNTASEVTYRLDKTYSGKTQLFLDRMACKPMQSYGYAVDTYHNIVAIAALVPGIGMPVYSGNIVVDPERMPNMLPREKFCVYTHRPRDENPLGTSVLRPAYTPWNGKMQLIPEYLKYLKQFGSPSIIATTPQEAMALALTDPQGQPLQGSNGPLIAASPEQRLLSTMLNFQNGSVAVVPFGTEVKWMDMHGAGNPLLSAFRWLDEQIIIGIKGQTMTSMTQAHGTQALGTVQRGTFDTLVRQIRQTVAKVLLRDLLRKWVRYNYGAKEEILAPRPTLGATEAHDLRGDLTAFSGVGYYLDPSQFQGVDQRLGMPVRSPDWELAAPPQQGSRVARDARAAGQQRSPEEFSQSDGSNPTISAPTQPTRPPVPAPPAALAANRRETLSNERWHTAVAMNQALKARTGVSFRDADPPPPSVEQLQEYERELAALGAQE